MLTRLRMVAGALALSALAACPAAAVDSSTVKVALFAPVAKAIDAKDLKAFESAYISAVTACNSCHMRMGYGFIEVVKLGAPADGGMDYELKSNPGDVPR